MAKKINIDLDLRRSERREIQSDSQIGSNVIIVNKAQEQLFANCFDFSPNGMRLIIKTENRDLFKKNDKMQLSFIMPVSRELFDVEANIIWVKSSRIENVNALVLGLDFEGLSVQARSVLDNYIEISKMSNQMGSFVMSSPNFSDRLKDGSTWVAIVGICLVVTFAFFLGQSLNDLQGSGRQRVPASNTPTDSNK